MLLVDLEWRRPNWLSASGRQLFWLAVWRRSKVVPLMGIRYGWLDDPYGTKGLKSLRVGTVGSATWRSIENIYSAILARRAALSAAMN
jgi:hypothetical protein